MSAFLDNKLLFLKMRSRKIDDHIGVKQIDFFIYFIYGKIFNIIELRRLILQNKLAGLVKYY